MIYRLRLKGKFKTDPGIRVDWDSETGEFSGPGSDAARRLVEMCQRDGSSQPIPCYSHPIGDKISPEDLATILASDYRVGDALPWPDIDDDTPEGAVN